MYLYDVYEVFIGFLYVTFRRRFVNSSFSSFFFLHFSRRSLGAQEQHLQPLGELRHLRAEDDRHRQTEHGQNMQCCDTQSDTQSASSDHRNLISLQHNLKQEAGMH